MKFIIFDLDDTLLCGDCEAGWINFLVSKGLLFKKHMHNGSPSHYTGKKNKSPQCKLMANIIIVGVFRKELAKIQTLAPILRYSVALPSRLLCAFHFLYKPDSLPWQSWLFD